jgi:hypothetical protein
MQLKISNPFFWAQKTVEWHQDRDEENWVFLIFTFFLVLGIEPRASHMLSTHSITELYPQPCGNHFLIIVPQIPTVWHITFKFSNSFILLADFGASNNHQQGIKSLLSGSFMYLWFFLRWISRLASNLRFQNCWHYRHTPPCPAFITPLSWWGKITISQSSVMIYF